MVISGSLENKTSVVSLVILNYNGREYIERCIDSVLNQTYRNREIIIVDNASSDGSLEILKKKYSSDVRIVENKENLGFAEGNNIGMRMAKGRYIALLNNDAIADKNWLKMLVSAAERSDSSFGSWASKILFYEDRKIIDTVGHLLYPDGLNRGRGKGEADKGQYNKEEEVFCPSGCAALYLKTMLDKIGFFDADFFAYGDDLDLGMKARMAGWKCLYVPDAVVFHLSSATAGKYSTLKAYLVERNRIWILIKYFPLRYILLSPVYTSLRFIIHAYGALTQKGSSGQFVKQYSKFSLLGVLIKANVDALIKLPQMLKKRFAFKKVSRATTRDFSLWLQKYSISAREIALRD